MNSPRIIINLTKLIHNYQVVKERCEQNNINLTTVLKAVAGDPKIATTVIENGLTNYGDSRLSNFRGLTKHPNLTKVLLRLPALSSLKEVIELTDISLNTEVMTLSLLNDLVGSLSTKKYQVILMVDLGDLREGVSEDEIIRLGAECRRFKNIEVVGVGANFSCFTGVKPSISKLTKLIDIAHDLKNEFNFPIRFISGGNSSSLPLLYDNALPTEINHLRIGEGILLGRETLTGSNLPDLFQDVFILETEVLQAQWKPDQPEGEVGFNAFGIVPTIPRCGAGFRALINIGQQDTSMIGITPLEPGLTVLGGSSDYLVLASEFKLKIGTTVRFAPDYWSVLSLMTSPYITKHYLV